MGGARRANAADLHDTWYNKLFTYDLVGREKRDILRRKQGDVPDAVPILQLHDSHALRGSSLLHLDTLDVEAVHDALLAPDDDMFGT